MPKLVSNDGQSKALNVPFFVSRKYQFEVPKFQILVFINNFKNATFGIQMDILG